MVGWFFPSSERTGLAALKDDEAAEEDEGRAEGTSSDILEDEGDELEELEELEEPEAEEERLGAVELELELELEVDDGTGAPDWRTSEHSSSTSSETAT